MQNKVKGRKINKCAKNTPNVGTNIFQLKDKTLKKNPPESVVVVSILY